MAKRIIRSKTHRGRRTVRGHAVTKADTQKIDEVTALRRALLGAVENREFKSLNHKKRHIAKRVVAFLVDVQEQGPEFAMQQAVSGAYALRFPPPAKKVIASCDTPDEENNDGIADRP